MNYIISTDRKTLTLTVDIEEQDALRELHAEDPESFGTSEHECAELESLIANSELDWVNPAQTGDLTDAPMLGIPLDEEPLDRFTGNVSERWAFMSYQVRSFLHDLADKGEAVFIS